MNERCVSLQTTDGTVTHVARRECSNSVKLNFRLSRNRYNLKFSTIPLLYCTSLVEIELASSSSVQTITSSSTLLYFPILLTRAAYLGRYVFRESPSLCS
jgi:hypothetical protein